MTGRGGGGGRKVLLPPINFIFKLLQSHATVKIWLYEQLAIRIEGKIRGFDEFMNLVIDDAVEVKQITKTNPEEKRRALGMIQILRDTGDRAIANCCKAKFCSKATTSRSSKRQYEDRHGAMHRKV
ncbi:hypothetical protein SCAR479_09708 [Seiridium cardinale]|uniref:Small nuclear ribonucleoprotein E n=1 Tax=Seiridium cardinale TaxID=138064 RepID=A0ABR2XIG7_9PEZI